MADSLTTKRSQRVREAICRKSAQTFHLPLVKYEDEYIAICQGMIQQDQIKKYLKHL